MKAAFSTWNNRVAPVFDVGRHIRIVEVVGGRIVSEIEETLPFGLPAEKALRLAHLGIGALVCGAISRGVEASVGAYGINVIPFVAGDLRGVIEAWVNGRLESQAFAMPGCGGRGRRCLRVRRQSGKGVLSMNTMEDIGQGRGGGGPAGRGAGRGQGNRRGQGQGGPRAGRMGGPQAAGPNGSCVCPQCGHQEPHKRGQPCAERTCPKCGVNLIRK